MTDETIPVHVTTRFADGTEAHVVVDHANREHRQWLGKHCFWAFRNGASVITAPTDESVTFVAKNRAA